MTALDRVIAEARERYVSRHPRDLAAYVVALAQGAPRVRGLPCPVVVWPGTGTCLDGLRYVHVSALPVRIRPGLPARAALLLALDADEAGLLVDPGAPAFGPVPEAALAVLARRSSLWEVTT